MIGPSEKASADERSGSWLRLYIAGETPNSARAEQNLRKALGEVEGLEDRLNLKIIDVFKEGKRALADGVIVTPTLIGSGAGGRVVMIGDLSESPRLALLLRTLVSGGTSSLS